MHLFAGIGGGLLADLILGHKPVVAVEWEPYACRVLRERAAEGWFPGLHVWEGDVRLFDPSEYAGSVDCIHAGFPCQDISVAGKQAGVSEGTRSGLYREVLRIADSIRPKFLFLENVAAILSNGLGTVLGDLAAMGYDARWCCIRASDVGAPHHRDRWFLLADSKSTRAWADNGGLWQRISGISGRKDAKEGNSDVADSSGKFSDGINDNSGEQLECGSLSESRNSCRADHVAEAYGAQRQGVQRQGVQRQERIPTEYADFSGASWWEIEPGLGRVADGVSNRVGQLKGYGNAQVPLQAAAAFKFLHG